MLHYGPTPPRKAKVTLAYVGRRNGPLHAKSLTSPLARRSRIGRLKVRMVVAVGEPQRLWRHAKIAAASQISNRPCALHF